MLAFSEAFLHGEGELVATPLDPIGILDVFLKRSTLLFVIAAALSLAAVYIAHKHRVSTALCWFSIGWHIAIADSVEWVIDSCRGFGLVAADLQWALITSLLSLVIPLVSLAVICLAASREENSIERGPMILCMSCSIALADLILLLFVALQVVMTLPASII